MTLDIFGVSARHRPVFLALLWTSPLYIFWSRTFMIESTALFLSVLGLYGALNDAARKRGRELAVRIALGARRRDVIGQVLQEGGRLAGAGTLAGLLGSLLLSRLATQITPGNGSPTVWVWLAGPVMLAGAVAIASVLPARRASMVDPLSILREEN